MGDFRIVINGIGGHGQDRDKKNGEIVNFQEDPSSPDALAENFVKALKEKGISIEDASIIHWPLDNYGGQLKNERSQQIVDDLQTGKRIGSF